MEPSSRLSTKAVNSGTVHDSKNESPCVLLVVVRLLVFIQKLRQPIVNALGGFGFPLVFNFPFGFLANLASTALGGLWWTFSVFRRSHSKKGARPRNPERGRARGLGSMNTTDGKVFGSPTGTSVNRSPPRDHSTMSL